MIIGVSGFARTGKDLYCSIVKDICTKNGLVAKRYAFADELKREVEPFLKDVCGVNVWTDNTEIKSDIRDFLVWYGTTFWRKHEPMRWVSRVENAIKSDQKIDVALISDVRYPNEGYWVHANEGWLIHLSKFVDLPVEGGRHFERVYQTAPNLEEEKNDPLVKKMADYEINWQDMSNNGTVKINTSSLVDNMYLRESVFKSLQACPSLFRHITKM